jgi:hypothetical protein
MGDYFLFYFVHAKRILQALAPHFAYLSEQIESKKRNTERDTEIVSLRIFHHDILFVKQKQISKHDSSRI